VDSGQLGGLLLTRGIYLTIAERRTEAIAYYREAARLTDAAGNYNSLGRVLLNLADALTATDPAAGAEAARAAAGHLRRTGARDSLAWAITNLVAALMVPGAWDAADEELTQAVDSDGLGDHEFLGCWRGLLAALRGDVATAESMLAALQHMSASEDPQDQALISVVQAFIAAARRQPGEALRLARAILDHAAALGIGHEICRWAWPLAARAAHDLGDAAAVRELLALLDSYRPGYLPPMMRAERDLVRARLAAGAGDPDAGAAFSAAISGMRELSTAYHLAHGLLDHGGYLIRSGDPDAAGMAVSEARDIAQGLRCQPLLDRAGDIMPAESRIRA
jgi:hypothetical protein